MDLSQMLNGDFRAHLCLGSKDGLTSLSTQRNSIDKSTLGDFVSIRFEFQLGNVGNFSWIPGKINLANALAKEDSSSTEAVQFTLYNCWLKIDYSSAEETKATQKNYGWK